MKPGITEGCLGDGVRWGGRGSDLWRLKKEDFGEEIMCNGDFLAKFCGRTPLTYLPLGHLHLSLQCSLFDRNGFSSVKMNTIWLQDLDKEKKRACGSGKQMDGGATM